MCTQFAKEWNRKLVKGEKGENTVYDALRKIGYRVSPFRMLEEGEISLQRKKEKLQEPRFPDAFASYIGDDEPLFESCFFLDAKFKSNEAYLGVVNVIDYDGYVKFLRNFTVQVPFKIFFYLHDVKQIWIHDLRKPDDDPNLESTITILRGAEVYQIFRSELKRWRRVVYTD